MKCEKIKRIYKSMRFVDGYITEVEILADFLLSNFVAYISKLFI